MEAAQEGGRGRSIPTAPIPPFTRSASRPNAPATPPSDRPGAGPPAPQQAKRFIRLTTAVQDLLGEHQDMTVAITEVENLLPKHPDDREFQNAAQILLCRLRKTADDSRAAFLDLWPKLAKKKTRRWFKRRD